MAKKEGKAEGIDKNRVRDYDLEILVREMNKIMELQPPIDDTLTKEELIKEIKLNAEAPNNEGLRHDDPFSIQAKMLFKDLGIKTPEEWDMHGIEQEMEATGPVNRKGKNKGKEEPVAKKPEKKKATTKKKVVQKNKQAVSDLPNSCYGHRGGSKAAVLDEAIKAGGTIEKIAKAAKRDISAVRVHIQHLKTHHKLKHSESDKGVIKVISCKNAH